MPEVNNTIIDRRKYLTLIVKIISTFTFSFLLKACASIVPPGGGPKDEDPPRVIKTVPLQNSLNYKGRVVEIIFDEAIKTEKLSSSLIIAPNIKNKFRYNENKNKLSLRFEDDFPDNTTVSLNFRESIKDLNEGNVLKDFVLAFSTGNTLDTLKIEGTVQDLLTKKPVNEALIAIYTYTDTLDIKTHLPTYISRTDKTGKYVLKNIKQGKYAAVSFIDANGNLKYDNKTEALAFLTQPLTLNADTTIHFFLSFHDAEPPKIQKNLSSKPGCVLYINEGLDSLHIAFADKNQHLPYEYDPTENQIKIYNTRRLKDSVLATITLVDSSLNTHTEKIFLKLSAIADSVDAIEKSPVKGKKIRESLLKTQPEDKGSLKLYEPIVLKFSHLPIGLSANAFLFNADSTTYQPLPALKHKPFLKRAAIPTSGIKVNQKLYLAILKNTIKLVNDSIVAADTLTFIIQNPSEGGKIAGKVLTKEHMPLLAELLTDGGKLLESNPLNNNEFRFLYLQPGKYMIRIVHDRNLNGRWDGGNYLKKQLPEPVYLAPEIINIKAGWEIEDLMIRPDFSK